MIIATRSQKAALLSRNQDLSPQQSQLRVAEIGIQQASSRNSSAGKEFNLSALARQRTPEFSFKKSSERFKRSVKLERDSSLDKPCVKPKQVNPEGERLGSLDRNNWLDMLCKSNLGLSRMRCLDSSIRRVPPSLLKQNFREDNNSITPFDENLGSVLKVEEVVQQAEAAGEQVEKRKRGRPPKKRFEEICPLSPGRNGLENLSTADKVHQGTSAMKESEKKMRLTNSNLLVIQANNYGFISDGEEQVLNMKDEELKKFEESDGENECLAFGKYCEMREVGELGKRKPLSTQDASLQSFCLDFNRLIKSIDEVKCKMHPRQFICRFCGRAFDKPSSLGGHTAKSHFGLSTKFKKRVIASNNRRTERDRIQFMKNSIARKLLN
jgi:hypothetical protein